MSAYAMARGISGALQERDDRRAEAIKRRHEIAMENLRQNAQTARQDSVNETNLASQEMQQEGYLTRLQVQEKGLKDRNDASNASAEKRQRISSGRDGDFIPTWRDKKGNIWTQDDLDKARQERGLEPDAVPDGWRPYGQVDRTTGKQISAPSSTTPEYQKATREVKNKYGETIGVELGSFDPATGKHSFASDSEENSAKFTPTGDIDTDVAAVRAKFPQYSKTAIEELLRRQHPGKYN